MTAQNNPIVIVTGASRGVGKGVALALGRKGATVYITGRTAAANDSLLPGTIHETAAEVTEAGGKGIAIRCDHADDAAVAALFDRVMREQGRLDILVNNVSDIHPAFVGPRGFWDKPIELARLIDVGLRSHYVASHHAARIMVPQRHGLIAGISFYGAVSYFHGPVYGAQKAGLDKMLADMAVELRPYQVATISLWPGMVATERVLAGLQAAGKANAAITETFESPEFSGLVIDAVYRDPDYMALSGRTLIGAELAQHYGIIDINGKTPPSLRRTLGGPPEPFGNHDKLPGGDKARL